MCGPAELGREFTEDEAAAYERALRLKGRSVLIRMASLAEIIRSG